MADQDNYNQPYSEPGGAPYGLSAIIEAKFKDPIAQREAYSLFWHMYKKAVDECMRQYTKEIRFVGNNGNRECTACHESYPVSHFAYLGASLRCLSCRSHKAYEKHVNAGKQKFNPERELGIDE